MTAQLRKQQQHRLKRKQQPVTERQAGPVKVQVLSAVGGVQASGVWCRLLCCRLCFPLCVASVPCARTVSSLLLAAAVRRLHSNQCKFCNPQNGGTVGWCLHMLWDGCLQVCAGAKHPFSSLYKYSSRFSVFLWLCAEAAKAFLQQRLHDKVKRSNDMLRPTKHFNNTFNYQPSFGM